MPNVQWKSYSFVWLYLIKCVVCVLNYMFDQTKNIFDHFICIWKWFLSLFVFIFNAYFVFHCFKHVLCWKTGVRIFGDSFWQLTRELRVLATHSQVASSSRDVRDLPSRKTPRHKMPRNNFLKGFSWETCFKPLLSSLKPIF